MFTSSVSVASPPHRRHELHVIYDLGLGLSLFPIRLVAYQTGLELDLKRAKAVHSWHQEHRCPRKNSRYERPVRAFFKTSLTDAAVRAQVSKAKKGTVKEACVISVQRLLPA